MMSVFNLIPLPLAIPPKHRNKSIDSISITS
ncbi:hypothetical protein SAMN05192529_10924 [Arachidicoccus rhizosphaerae]|uniref:Uncharacterized protein n=1 Tax=Arachidicoccus rhizosphaerae TaxID=551991 RepID=A0A1H3YTU8_9BACT|nr:hypothetical protein SAMN05192529_10924 [Arachidicoccus rhizosphaerae]